MKKILALIIALVFVSASQSLARQIQSDIIQVKLNRIYFASGTEDGIGVGASFIIECEGSELISGAVEYAGPGISYSRPLAELDSLEIFSDCTARLTASGIDSSATIIIGTDMPIRFFDPEHEPLFTRIGDTVLPNLVDSIYSVGNFLSLYLRRDIRFSDGSLLNAETLAHFLNDIRNHGRSYLTRYFFSKLLPGDSGGIELIDGFTVELQFYHPLPRALYFLSHPDFAVYNQAGSGTGPAAEYPDPERSNYQRIFTPNRYYRGDPVAFSKLIVRYFEQQYRMKFAYENNQIDGYVGFGFESDLAGLYEAKALFPEIAVMVAGIEGELFSQALFPTSLYYCFNPSLAHIYFQFGETIEVNRWLVSSVAGKIDKRFYPFDFLNGRELHGSVKSTDGTAQLIYDHNLLYETTRYVADIVAREGMTAPVNRMAPDGKYDIRLKFIPASDRIMPFALFAAVLEFNDQNITLSPDRRLDRPGWRDTDQGSRLYEVKNRNNFFARAEETVIQDGGFFPLYRPYTYAVSPASINGLSFDFYGYPILGEVIKFTGASARSGTESGR